LLGYEFDIVYKVGASNKVVDALSRRDEDKELQGISRPFWKDITKINEEVQKDPALAKIREELKDNLDSHPQYTLECDILYFRGRLVLLASSLWIPKLLQEFQTSLMGGHSGIYITYRRITQSLYWIPIKGEITKFVVACHVGQRSKYQASSPAGLLQPLPIPNAIWEEISMNFIVGMLKSKGFDVILVEVDKLSKYRYFIVIKHPYFARSIVDVKEIIWLLEVPISIVSDSDLIFMSHFLQELFKLQRTSLKMSTTYYPKSNGQT